VHNTPGRTLQLHALALLRDDDGPFPDRCVIGGKVSPAAGIKAVTMVCGEKNCTARVTAGGNYLFMDKLDRGSIVSITGIDESGGRHTPDNGNVMEVCGNTMEINFS
jgi:hypothetical protein